MELERERDIEGIKRVKQEIVIGLFVPATKRVL